MAGDAESESDAGGFKLYHYDPSFAAAVLFAILFAGSLIRHAQLLFKTRMWSFIPFLIGCLCKCHFLLDLRYGIAYWRRSLQLKPSDTPHEPTRPSRRPTGL